MSEKIKKKLFKQLQLEVNSLHKTTLELFASGHRCTYPIILSETTNMERFSFIVDEELIGEDNNSVLRSKQIGKKLFEKNKEIFSCIMVSETNVRVVDKDGQPDSSIYKDAVLTIGGDFLNNEYMKISFLKKKGKGRIATETIAIKDSEDKIIRNRLKEIMIEYAKMKVQELSQSSTCGNIILNYANNKKNKTN